MQATGVLGCIGIIVGFLAAVFLGIGKCFDIVGRVERDKRRLDGIEKRNNSIGDGIDRAQDLAKNARDGIDRAQSIIESIRKRNAGVDEKP